MTSIVNHPQYDVSIPELKKVRDCVLGSAFIKDERYLYLRHPSQIEPDSKVQQMRYNMYLEGADFPEDTSSTMVSLLGKLRIGDSEPELPSKLDYLINDVDNDGTQLTAAIENSASEVLQVKYNLLVATFNGLENANISDMSKTDVKALNLRAAVKRYTRESIIDWDFQRINGVMQLTYLKLLEVDYSVDRASGSRSEIKSYLVLGVDGEGYYQQRFTEGENQVNSTEKSYVTVGGKNLKWLPVQFVSDQEFDAGTLPRGFGFLHKVADAALSAYRVSARYKEAMESLLPTMFNSGWKAGDMDIFKQANGQRDYVMMGGMANNNMPEGVTTDIVSGSVELRGFEYFLEQANKKMQRLGGKPDNAVQMTATEAEINAAEQNALLNSTVTSLENGWTRIIAYCGMFEGLYSPDDIESNLDDIHINLNKDFTKAKLSVEEVQVLMELESKQVISTKKLLTMLLNGGWEVDDLETLKLDLEGQPPKLDLPTIGEDNQNLTNNTIE